jgi:hypothetical protein
MVSHLLVETHVHALLISPTHVAIQTEGCSWWMQYMCKEPFGSHCIMPSHCTLILLLIHHYMAPCLWNGSHITLNHASFGLYCWNLYFETRPACINTMSTSAGSRTNGRIYWQMKNNSTAQSHHPNHLWRPNILFCNCYLGLILRVNQPEGEAHHYSNKCGLAVTLAWHSLSLSHTHTRNIQTK